MTNGRAPWLPFQTKDFESIRAKLTDEEFAQLDAAYTTHAYELTVQHCSPKLRHSIANLLAHNLAVTGIIMQTASHAYVFVADQPTKNWGWGYSVDPQRMRETLITGLKTALAKLEAEEHQHG